MDILKCHRSWMLILVFFLTAGYGGKVVTFNNNEFYIETTGRRSITWEAARDDCESQNAKLASITSMQENDFLKDHVTNNYEYWIGLLRSDSCTCLNVSQQACTNCRLSWTWQDTTQMSYYSWESEEPNNHNSECGRYRASTGWADRPCNKTIFFICKREINECSSSPCHNGGRCVDGVNSYQCVCAEGYSGTSCELEINECSSNPCRNSGRCEDRVNRYQCVCAEEYSGTNCEREIDECSSSPCRHGGRCEDRVNRYQCVCADGYSGTNCELVFDSNEQNNNNNVNTGLIVAVAMLAAVVVALVIGFLVYVRQSRRVLIQQRTSTEEVSRYEQSMQQMTVNPTPSEYQDLHTTTYDEIKIELTTNEIASQKEGKRHGPVSENAGYENAEDLRHIYVNDEQ